MSSAMFEPLFLFVGGEPVDRDEVSMAGAD
jgi:hypothetical protein